MASSFRLAAAGAALVLSGVAGCGLLVGFHDYTEGAGGAGGQGGAATASNSSNSSNSSSTSGANGTSSSSASAATTSSSGGCVTPPDPTKGDCHKPACVGGSVVTVVDDTDKPADTEGGCVHGLCTSGVPLMNSAPNGDACFNGVDTGECCNGHCSSIDHCTDMCKDNGETDVDCGGMQCSPCGSGKFCLQNADCTSMSCDPVTLTCN